MLSVALTSTHGGKAEYRGNDGLQSNGAVSIPARYASSRRPERCEPISHEARISGDDWRKLTGTSGRQRMPNGPARSSHRCSLTWK